MARDWGLGPVFAYEWLTSTRRWQLYAGRVLFLGILLLGLSAAWVALVAREPEVTIPLLAALGRLFYRTIVFTQLTAVLLVAPAATAGGVCLDKTRGNLAQLLITDLSDAEIVLGKLAARLVPVIGMVCGTLPVLAVSTLLGGVDPLALTGAFFVTIAVAILGATIALTFSIWGSKPYEVLLATFTVFAVWLIAFPTWEMFVWLRGFPPLPRWVLAGHPYILAFGPYDRPGLVGAVDYLGFVALTSSVSAGLVALSVRRVRRVVIGQADRPLVRAPSLLTMRIGGGDAGPGPSLDANPVLWYEWHRRRPTRWLGRLIGVYVFLAVSFSALAIQDCFRTPPPIRGWFPAYVNAFQVVMGLPLLLIGGATALVDERSRGSLDILLTTPLSTRSIVLAKWWSVYRPMPLLLLMPTLVATVLAWPHERWPMVVLLVASLLASGAAWTSIGLVLSTWIPRVGRAVSTAVVLYAVVCLGWPMLALMLFGGLHQPGPELSSISPFHGLFNLTFQIEFPDYVDHLLPWMVAWTVAQAAVAAGLLVATLASFNRCLGRIPERRLWGRPASKSPIPAPVDLVPDPS